MPDARRWVGTSVTADKRPVHKYYGVRIIVIVNPESNRAAREDRTCIARSSGVPVYRSAEVGSLEMERMNMVLIVL